MGWILSGMMLLVLAGIVILNLFRGKKRLFVNSWGRKNLTKV